MYLYSVTTCKTNSVELSIQPFFILCSFFVQKLNMAYLSANISKTYNSQLIQYVSIIVLVLSFICMFLFTSSCIDREMKTDSQTDMQMERQTSKQTDR